MKFKIDLIRQLADKIKTAGWRIKFFKAQSLLELLVAIAVGTIMIGGSVLLMATSLRAYQSIKQRTAINSLSRQLSEIIIALTHNNWHYLTSVCDCEVIGVPGMGCSLVENNGQWEVYVSEDGCLPEEGVLNNIAYRRYYAILPVSRTNGEIDNEYNDEHEDSSTKKVVIVVEYGKSQDNYTGSESLIFYLTRSSNNQVIQQTDWSGGPGQTGPLPNPGNKFDTSDSNINYASTTGSIYQTTATSTVSSLTSSIIDTGIEGGAGFNSLLWQGSLGSGGSVKFQIAFSNAASGPWIYYGPTATSDYYQPNPNVSIAFPTTGSASPQNNRYLRYKVFLSTTGTSPQINDIIINWSP